MRLRRLAPLALLLALPVFASPVAADCEPAGPIDAELPDAEVAFVGTVTHVAGGSARFTVTEVWAGTVGREVEVMGLGVVAPGRGGPEAGTTLVEDDRLWEVGETYLVLPILHEGMLRDHECTATTVWRPELEAFRPQAAEVIEARTGEGAATSRFPLELAAVAAIAVAVLGGSWIGFRRR